MFDASRAAPVEATVTQVDDNRAVAVVERRDPQAATGAAQYINPMLPMIAEWDAEAAIRMGMLANVYVYRCLRIRAQAIAGLPFRAGRDADKPGEWNKDAPLARLLGPAPFGPNTYVSAHRLWAYSVAQFDATGRFGWEIELEPRTKRPVAIWPLVSSLLRPVPTDGGAAWWKKFEYGVGGKTKTLTTDQCFYEWRPSATDYRQPESVLQAARLTISTAVMLERYAYSFLMNDAKPATVVVSEVFGSQEEREAWRSQFLASHRGPNNAGRPIFTEVEGGGDKGVLSALEIKTLGLSQTDAKMIEQAEQCVKAICAVFGTPLSKVSNSTDTTFTNSRQDDINWWRDEIHTEIVELQDAVNMQLAPRLGDEVGWFDISGVPQLRSSKLLDLGRALPPLVGVAVMADEVRSEIDLPPLPNGVGQFATGGNPALGAPALAAAVVAAPATPEPAAAIPEVAPASTAPTARQAPRLAPGHERGDGRPLAAVPARVRSTRDQRAAEWRRVDAQVRTLEGAWRVAFRRLFADQKASTLAKLKGQRRRLRQAERRDDPPAPDAATIFDAEAWTARTAETASSLYAQTVAVGAARAGAKFDHTLDVTAKGPKAFIDARANQLAGQVTDTTYSQIQEALKAGVDAGEGIDDIATRVADVFDAADGARAEMIARTECISAWNGATVLVGEDLGADVVGGQEWIAQMGDDRTREDHADADGQQVRMGESFDVGDEQLAYPGDPDGSPENVINCRCVPGTTLIDSTRVQVAYRRWYDGDLVRIRTAGGHELSVTPNHPVLTPTGWVEAGRLGEGDDIISGAVSERAAGGDPHVPDVPTEAAQLFDAVALGVVPGSTQRIRSSPVDFHGDGREGQVEVAFADLELAGDVEAALRQERGHLGFAPAEGEVGGSGHLAANFGALHPEALGFGPAPDGGALSPQPCPDDAPVGAVALRERLLTDARGVLAGNLLIRQSQTRPDGGRGSRVVVRAQEPPAFQFSGEPGRADVTSPAGGDHIGTIQVSLDRVLEVGVRRFSGHVYNFQCAGGAYIADGIVTHNCTTGLLTPDELDDTARLARLSEARRRRADRVGQLAVAWEYGRMTEEVA